MRMKNKNLSSIFILKIGEKMMRTKIIYIKIVLILTCLIGLILTADNPRASSAKALSFFPIVGSPESEFKLIATSAGLSSLKETYIVLYWTREPKAAGYNLYRSQDSASPVRLNERPITIVRTCDELKNFIRPYSPEWMIMLRAFLGAGRPEKTGVPEKVTSDLSKTSTTEGTKLYIPSLSSNRGVGVTMRVIQAVEATLCQFFEAGLTNKQQAIFEALASYNLKFRLAYGLAFIDEEVTPDQEYVYEVRPVDSQGKEMNSVAQTKVRAGHFVLPAAPQNLQAKAGDTKVLLTWDRRIEDFTYNVLRAERRTGPYLTVNAQPVVFDVETDLEGNELEKTGPGFIDFQRWNEEGLPVTHEVEGHLIDGPKNGRAYFYKVVAIDILGRRGAESAVVEVTPQDTTPPAAPDSLVINVSPTRPELIFNWKKSIRDVAGHREQDRRHIYRLYRAERMEDLQYLAIRPPEKSRRSMIPEEVMRRTKLAISSLRPIAEITADPSDISSLDLTWTDSWPGLVPEYGEKDFFYCLVCVDESGNRSSPSAIISGRIPDRTCPGPTRVVGSEGRGDHIKIFWLPNSEPDVAGYQIYRSTCDRGSVYRPVIKKEQKQITPCDFILIGQVLLREGGAEVDSSGRFVFEDRTIPEGSPICYSYWVRAFDQARNIYSGNADLCPESGEFVCEKLYEEIPPPPPVITGLKAKNRAVLIEWTSSPIQDLRAFHVYRSLKENEEPEFVACVYVDGTPPSRERWRGMKHPPCAEIPAEPNPVSLAVSYLDNTVEPNTVYWYRVSALDWLGNESQANNLLSIPAIGTFTYSKDLPPKPVVEPPAGPPAADCGRIIRWRPLYDETRLQGFIVFRSRERNGVYHQISPIIKGNEFKDTSALQGMKYWYRVQSVDLRGKLSEASEPVQY